jgi:hypothetical protein
MNPFLLKQDGKDSYGWSSLDGNFGNKQEPVILNDSHQAMNAFHPYRDRT